MEDYVRPWRLQVRRIYGAEIFWPPPTHPVRGPSRGRGRAGGAGERPLGAPGRQGRSRGRGTFSGHALLDEGAGDGVCEEPSAMALLDKQLDDAEAQDADLELQDQEEQKEHEGQDGEADAKEGAPEAEDKVHLSPEERRRFEAENVPGMSAGARDRGAVRINEREDKLIAVCYKCKYRLTRTYHPRRGVADPSVYPQGRCMGLLLSWLQVDCGGDAGYHRDQQWCQTYSSRKACRDHYRSLGGLTAQFGKERPPWDHEVGEDPEPKDPP